MQKFPTLAFVLSLLVACLAPMRAERTDEMLTSGWKFVKQDVGPTADTTSWTDVALPHSWNALDGQDGVTSNPNATQSNAWTPGEGVDLKAAAPKIKEDYYRGACWYARKLDVPSSAKGRRVFLYFEAASSVAQVWLNGQTLGEHRGAFTAFCFEITQALNWEGPNELRVRVDNKHREDLPPISGDFTLAGGLYRPVHLVVTDEVCISPLDSASPGVYLTVRRMDERSAMVVARILVSSAGKKTNNAVIETFIYTPEGKRVEDARTELNIPAGQTTPVEQVLSIRRPHRWSGRADPFVYRVVVRVKRGGKVVDTIEQPLGLRTVAIAEDRGFLLNENPYPVHGVNRHQDARDKAWALSDADHEQDFKLIAEVGATAVRLAHYPQSKKVYDLADHVGLLIWNEVSLVDYARNTPEFIANAESQLRELMLQHFNHPSVAFIGLFNEIRGGAADEAYPVIKHLQDVAKSIDPTRLTVAAPNVLGQKINQIPDRLGFNVYPGWYSGVPEDLSKMIDQRYEDAGNRRVALSEYGAGGNPDQHEEGKVKMPPNRSHWHPEEWMNEVHERDWAQCRANPKLWGTFLWVMFDFASDSRNEGAKPGINDKGLVTQDRLTKKDAFFFYKANWNRRPVVYITSRRATPRRASTTEVKVYSNTSSVELMVNGRSMGRVAPDAVKVARWPSVTLQSGENRIEAVGRSEGPEVHDECVWTVDTVY